VEERRTVGLKAPAQTPSDVLIDCEMAPSDFTAIPLPPSY
jgi:hypothetical protein